MTNILLAVIILLLLRVLYNQKSTHPKQESRDGRPLGIIEWSLVVGWIVLVVWFYFFAYNRWIR